MKKSILHELIFYIILPLGVWNYGRGFLEDYYAMLLSTVPGIVYTLHKTIKGKELNVTGIFILITLFIRVVMDLLSQSAEALLWNGVYLNGVTALFWIITIIIGKPMVMYFFIDYASLQGESRDEMHELYRKKAIYKYFIYLTSFFVLRDIVQGFIKVYFILRYGVDGFNTILIMMRVVNACSSGLFVLGILYTIKKIKEYLRDNKLVV